MADPIPALDAWLTKEGMRYADLGRAIGVPSRSAERYAKAERRPGPDEGAAIERLTRGEVTVLMMHQDWKARRGERRSPVGGGVRDVSMAEPSDKAAPLPTTIGGRE